MKRVNLRIVFAILVLLLLTGKVDRLLAQDSTRDSVSAKGSRPWSLRACVEYAEEHSLSVKRFETDIRRAEISLNTTQMSLLPSASASLGQSFGIGRSTTREGLTLDQNTMNSNIGVNANLTLFRGFQTINEIKASKLELGATLMDLERGKLDLALNVASAFYEVIFAKEVLAISEEQMEMTKKQEERIAVSVGVGRLPENELVQVKSLLSSDYASVVEARNRVKSALLTLSQLLEIDYSETFDVEYLPELLPDGVAVVTKELMEQAIAMAPEIKAGEMRLSAVRHNVLMAKGAYLPTLSFGVNLSDGYFRTDGIMNLPFSTQVKDNLQWTIGFQLSVPLFNKFATRNRVRMEELNYTYRDLDLQQNVKNIENDVHTARLRLESSREKYEALKESFLATKGVLELEQVRFEGGVGTIFEFEDARNNYLRTALQLKQNVYECIFNYKVLMFHLGERFF